MKRLHRYGPQRFRAVCNLALPLLLLVAACFTLENIAATPLAGLRNAQFDRYQRQMPRARSEEPVIVVGIDSQSLAQYGQWPWSRDLIARLVHKIHAGNPLALGIDIVFAEPDRNSPAILGQRFPHLADRVLAMLPEPDTLLAQALTDGPSVLSVIGLQHNLAGSRQPAKPLAIQISHAEAANQITNFPAALTSRRELEQTAAGEGLINTSSDSRQPDTEHGILRQVPCIGLINQQAFLSLPLEMIRQALGASGTVGLSFDSHGLTGVSIGDYHLPTDNTGNLRLHYGHASSHYYLSAAQVLAENFPAETFKARFVIIGFNSTGLQDSIVTALGESVPGTDIHVQVIESMLAGRALKRPWWMPRLELLVLLGAGLLLIATLPARRPRLAVACFGGLAGLLIGAGYLAFLQGQWLFDGPSLIVLLSPLFMTLLVRSWMASEAYRRQAETALQHSREEAARVSGELNAARRIQMGLLPDLDTLLAHEKRCCIAARLEPAREVGGDYFDCFWLADGRLCLTIGDVSGKGIPASLFMAISKTLTGTLARRQSDLGQAMRELEQELGRHNPEYLFVTTFVALADLESGELEYVCAGHDAPLRLRQGVATQLDTQRMAGPPLCVTDDYPYTADRTRLLPGDRLCFFTDGITEASDGKSFYGNTRFQETLLAHATQSPAAQVEAVCKHVHDFESGYPSTDDLTLLVFAYRPSAVSAN